jgi:hypothetical protein
MPNVAWIAVIVATISAFVLGGLWYGPIFSKPWMREMGVGRDFQPRVSRPLLFAIAIALNFIAAVVFGLFVGPAPSAALAVGAGAAVGLAWVAPSIVIVYLFAARSAVLAVIDAGYAAAQFVLYGIVFAALG